MSKYSKTIKRLKRLAPKVPDYTCPDIDFIVDKIENNDKGFTRFRKKILVKKLERLRIRNEQLRERSGEDYSFVPQLRLEQTVQSIDGETDKIKVSNILKRLNIVDIRKLNKYVTEIEPGINFKTIARTPGGASVPCFLRFGSNFFWPVGKWLDCVWYL